MNEDKPFSGEAAESEEPRSWWRQMWRVARERWQGSSEEVALREAVEELIEESAGESGKPTAERMLLDNILHLRERTVADCMVPRADIVAADAADGFEQLIGRMAEHAHSRIPVYRDTLDETLGMVHMKDVLPLLIQGKKANIRDLLRPVLFVAPSMPASRLLLQMRQSRQHMAMVVDEFGGIDGLVTIEDLVEEVVGEIEDEHDDPAAPDVIARPDGTLLVDGRLAIGAFEDRAGPLLTPEERETIDTLGGYVFHLAGHVPHIGETVAGPGRLLFEVLETDQNRIKRVRVRGMRKTAEAD
ncbi:MAG: hemolysin family protein [Alphaproteobacteria bacterium]|nr:hemolysin family protein [Alphaproteobacteria bacterium]